MQIERILKQLNQIDLLVSQTRDLLFCPKGIRIVIIKRDYLSLVEYWDGNQMPRLVGKYKGKVRIEAIHSLMYQTLTTMSLSDIENKNQYKEILSDIDIKDMPKFLVEAMNEVGINIYNKIDTIEHKELIKQMEKKYAAINSD